MPFITRILRTTRFAARYISFLVVLSLQQLAIAHNHVKVEQTYNVGRPILMAPQALISRTPKAAVQAARSYLLGPLHTSRSPYCAAESKCRPL